LKKAKNNFCKQENSEELFQSQQGFSENSSTVYYLNQITYADFKRLRKVLISFLS